MSAEIRDPLSKKIRRLLQGLHLVVAVGFCCLLAAGAWRGIAEIRPVKPIVPAAVSTCTDEAGKLRSDLLDRLAAFPRGASSAEEGKAFERWSVAFRGRLNDSRARCSPPAGASADQVAAVKKAFAAVTRSLDLSLITATHWARHLGPSLDESAEAIEAARAAR